MLYALYCISPSMLLKTSNMEKTMVTTPCFLWHMAQTWMVSSVSKAYVCTMTGTNSKASVCRSVRSGSEQFGKVMLSF